MRHNQEIQLATIDSDKLWAAYKKLVEQSNKQRGIEAEPLPEKRPQRSASTELDLAIQRFFDLWERDKPLQQVQEALLLTHQEFREDINYHYQQARFYLENTFSGIVSIVEDTLGLTPTNKIQYFIEPDEFLAKEELESPSTTLLEKDSAHSSPADTHHSSWSERLHSGAHHNFLATSQVVTNFAQKSLEKSVQGITSMEQAVYGFLSQSKGR